jgi:hypothetical protein
MPKFVVNVLRDANVTFSVVVVAKDLAEVESHMGRHGYQGPIVGDWIQGEPNTYDNVENYRVKDEKGNEIYDQDWG